MAVQFHTIQARAAEARESNTDTPGQLRIAILEGVSTDDSAIALRGLQERRPKEVQPPRDPGQRGPYRGPRLPPRLPPREPPHFPRFPEPRWPSPFPNEPRCSWHDLSFRRDRDWWCRW